MIVVDAFAFDARIDRAVVGVATFGIDRAVELWRNCTFAAIAPSGFAVENTECCFALVAEVAPISSDLGDIVASSDETRILTDAFLVRQAEIVAFTGRTAGRAIHFFAYQTFSCCTNTVVCATVTIVAACAVDVNVEAFASLAESDNARAESVIRTILIRNTDRAGIGRVFLNVRSTGVRDLSIKTLTPPTSADETTS